MRYFMTGTDTDVGKTVASAWIMLHLEARFGGARYWKPVQTGVPEFAADCKVVAQLTGLPLSRFVPSAYELAAPLSPHEAARREGVHIRLSDFSLPEGPKALPGPLVVEGAGGVLVPLNGTEMMADLIKALGLPVILVSRSALGTINHTLLSLEALRLRDIDVAGVVINGPPAPHNGAAIAEFGRVPVLAEIPEMQPLTRQGLLAIKPRFGVAT